MGLVFRKPEFDWWNSDSKGSALRDGAGELAFPAGLGDLAGFFDPHNRTIHYFHIGIALVRLHLADRPLEGSASERPLGQAILLT